MSIPLRFIIDKSRPAAFNMAADTYLLENCAHHERVTVRFYSWERPSVSLGCMQKIEDELDIDAMDGVDRIKRPTGGRAVLHDGDITYSCAFPKLITAMGSGITQTYRLISKCLMNGLERASIKCGAHDSDIDIRGIKRDVKLPCFLAPNRDEIMVDGRKLVGSAQKRTANAVLQHGSIPINGNFRKLPNYLRIDDSEKEKQIRLLTIKSCCVDELISGATFDSLTKRLMDGFSSVLPFDGELMPWTPVEEREISQIVNKNPMDY